MTPADLRPDPRDIALEAARERLQQALTLSACPTPTEARRIADTIELIDVTLATKVPA
jgi:hypothetical protein